MDCESITIAIGCDHAGYPLKAALAAALAGAGHAVLDMGCDSARRVDYPEYAHAVCRAVAGGRARFGVLVCGSGVGMSIAANRHTEIRCALLSEVTSARLRRAEVASLTRAQRMSAWRLAAIDMPMPLPHTSTPKRARPAATARQTAWA